MNRRFRSIASALLLCCCGITTTYAQDLYDPTIVRTFDITFTQSNWEQLLHQNYLTETDLAGTVVVDGVTYPNVGIRIRGNTSYTGLPQNSQKFSLKLEMDFIDPNQNLMGYDTVNLNNGWRDPTFTREVEFNNFLSLFVPNARANNAIVRINGANWGVYNNVQQTDKALLRRYFSSGDGLRVRCANSPSGPGLSYSPTLNASYEIQETGGLTLQQATDQFIELTRMVTQQPLANAADIQGMDRVFAIDPSTWTVVLENLLTDDDSYVNKGCDFMTYRDPVDNRTHLLQRDANETWTQTTWAITRNFSQTNKPVLNRILGVPELRQRYMAHYRVAMTNFNWANYFQARFEARRALIEAAVAADTKKIYTTQNFTDGFGSSSIQLTNRITGTPATGLAGGTIPGIRQFIEGRAAFLANADSNPELAVTGPTITNLSASNSTPAPGSAVFISANVTANVGGITKVELFYRADRTDIFLRIPMLDDGQSGDGGAGDGRYGVRLPFPGTPGQQVSYYAMATAGNNFNSLSFLPTMAEREPLALQYTLGGSQPLQITEFMYSGNQGEFVEITNRSTSAIDLTGWVLKDDQVALPGFSLTPAGTLAPNESLVVTDAVAATFRAAWNLGAGAKILGELGTVGAGGSNYGRSDQINLYDSTGTLIDRLAYGDQTFLGTIRTQNVSGQVPCTALGQNLIASWVLSGVGDIYGSAESNPNATNLRDIGSPGIFVASNCGADLLFRNGFE
ncbi:MAG: CotH kinase family protein [Rhodanobacteraceae bacterium]|nr:CotH kinase family protein [Rhodanobacteraceae bacterium]